ncbi:hypothetical protein HOLleu_40865 [Holothuria leucospilota]|uniref:Peptidase aspartic putative domain-containing protein n=1 Tax=Holothuria leucospilota TaxID=206669 RepID=A0A9Q1BDD9_HOLLE|nr:hypothetical protein HOLleu_40865 [Holothuria leucospilota]
MSPYLGIGEAHTSKACVGSYSEDNTANHWYQGGSQESPPTLSVPARQGINPRPTGYNIPKHVGPGIDNEQVTMNQTFSNMFDVFNFPKPEITRFDGNPGNFWTFVNGFEVNIASKNIDDRSKLMYLIQFCVGQAKESIEDCVLMPPGVGYRTAWQILRNQFGQGHLVTKSLVDKVVNREPIKPNDGKGLWDLERQMRKCQITLSQLGNVASMNNADTLMKVQNLLPLHLQKEWAKRAHGLIQMNVEPQFYHMTEFLEQSAQIANNMYGQNIGAKSRVERSQVSGSKGTDSSKFGQTGKNQKVTTLGTGSSPDSGFQGKSGSGGHRYCILCPGNHELSSCFQFKKYSLDKRVAFVRERRLCNNCLIPNHLAKGCLVAPKCTIDGCHKKHHTLLHFGNSAPLNVSQGSQDSGIIQPQRENGDVIGAGVGNKGNQNENKVDSKEIKTGTTHHATRPQDQPKVCLRAVPVTVNGTGTTRVQTWALLDDGSNISLCDQRLVSLLGLKGKPTKFNLNTVIGEGPSEFGLEVEMTARALSGNGAVHLPKVWSVDNLPIDKGSLPGVEDIQRWPHLKDIEFPQIEENHVMLLIGCDVPEAFWALEEKRGRRKEPFAIRSLLGWTIMGPVGTSATRGPDFSNSLLGVLLKFRQGPVAMAADIESMFLQVGVAEDDCDSLRFLWWPEGDISREPVDYKMVVHLFGATSSPSCAGFALKRTALDYEKHFDWETIQTVRNNFYVDDCLKSVETPAKAIKLSQQLRELLGKGGFRVTKWVSNDRKVLMPIPEAERASSVKCLFDPLGIVGPYVLKFKMILQEVCRGNLGWDEEIPAELANFWNQWLTELLVLAKVKVDRRIMPKAFNHSVAVELHNFSDASEKGYAAVSYLRLVDVDGTFTVVLSWAKQGLVH